MKTYANRGRAAPLNHMVYETWLKSLSLDAGDFASLTKRGLTSKQIPIAQYGTKPTNRANDTQKALAKVITEFDSLEGVPGFYQDDKTGHWNCHGISGIMIPVRDIRGFIHSLLVRNASPVVKNGRVINKYMQFSTGGRTKGGKAWQIAHCPVITGAAEDVCGTELRVTEGVLKADVATALGEHYCIGIQGLKLHDELPIIFEELEVSVIRICLDAGEDEMSDMIRTRAQLIKAARDYGADVIVELWDKKYGKGIDDVLAKGNVEHIREATKEEIDKFLEIANEKDPNNGDWIYCIGVERFVHIHDFTELKEKQFCVKFQMEKLDYVHKMLAAGFPQVDKLTFAPAQEKFVFEEKKHCLNVWVDPCIEPISGDITPFEQHLDYIFPHKHDQEILLDWMAWQVQHPGEKILWAMLIKGNEGIGKSFLGAVMKLLLGKENVSTPTNEAVHEPYTGWQKRAVLIIIEEVMSRGRLEFMNKFKPMITQDTTSVREMHKMPYEQPNRFNILMFTNYEDAIIVHKGDRRYCILKSAAVLQDPEYYTRLWDWLREEGTAAAMLDVLLKRDLSNFNQNAKAPDTSAKAEMVEISRTSLEEWIAVGIAEEAWPFQGDITCIRHLKSLKNAPFFLSKVSNYKIAEALKASGAVQFPDQIGLNDGSRARLWILRRHDMYEHEGKDFIKKKYEENALMLAPGGNPLEDVEPL